MDCLIDVQRWVDCLQNNNTHLVPQCATYFNCGLTSFDFPRAKIMRLSVIDKINPETGKEDATAADDHCSEIEYTQVDPCHMREYLGHTRTPCCASFSLGSFFAIPAEWCGNKHRVPVPTDEGVPDGLPALQLGYHYPQSSTDGTCRARAGVWAVENGRVLVAPWIQTTETIVLKWNGIKRDWVDADLVDDDPGLFRAVELFLRWEHARDWDLDPQKASAYQLDYSRALADLMYDCQQENLVRNCDTERGGGTGSSRGIAPVVKLFYNDQQQFTATCPPNQSGQPVTVVVPAETVASTISKGDANQLARQQAQDMATAQLDCQTVDVIYYNRAVIGSADCPAASGTTPAAQGPHVSVNIAAGGPGHGYSSTISEDDATAKAQTAADDLAEAQLACTFFNAPQTCTVQCPTGTSGPEVERTTPASSFSATTAEGGQAEANRLAHDEACRLAAEAMSDGGGCIGDPTPITVCNEDQGTREFGRTCPIIGTGQFCTVTVIVRIPAGVARGYGENPQLAANLLAIQTAGQKAQNELDIACAQLSTRSDCSLYPEPIQITLRTLDPDTCTYST